MNTMTTHERWEAGWKETLEFYGHLYMRDAIRFNDHHAALLADDFFASAEEIRAYERRMRDAAAEMQSDGIEACDECSFLVCQCGQFEDEDADWCRVCNTELGRGQCLDCREERYQQHLDTPVPAQRVKAANVQAGRTYYRSDDKEQKTFTVLDITSDYKRNSMSAYRTAQVKLATGETAEKFIYATSEYVEVL